MLGDDYGYQGAPGAFTVPVNWAGDSAWDGETPVSYRAYVRHTNYGGEDLAKSGYSNEAVLGLQGEGETATAPAPSAETARTTESGGFRLFGLSGATLLLIGGGPLLLLIIIIIIAMRKKKKK